MKTILTTKPAPIIIGLDEVGRGSLAGPVTVGGVAIHTDWYMKQVWDGLADSKKLSPAQREEWVEQLRKQKGVFTCCVRSVSNEYIDTFGIQQAVKLAACRVIHTIRAMVTEPIFVLSDHGIHIGTNHGISLIRGDEKEPAIAFASIYAKVFRDKTMIKLGRKYPNYDFHTNKGYGTSAHRRAIEEHGVIPIHRKSFLHTIRSV